MTVFREAFPILLVDDVEQASAFYCTTLGFAEAYRNVRAIGAERIDPPSGGSHYKVRFPGARPHPLDPNVDPLPDRFLGELAAISASPRGSRRTSRSSARRRSR